MSRLTRLVILAAVAAGPNVIYGADTSSATAQNEGIAPQALGDALTVFARRLGLQLIYASDLAAGRRSNGAPPGLSPADTLERILSGTGLAAHWLNERTISIQPAGNDEPAYHGVADVPNRQGIANNADTSSTADRVYQSVESGNGPAGPTGSPDDQNIAVQLEEVVVTGSHIRGIDNKTNPVMVIDRDQIDRSGYTTTQDLFRSLPQNFSSGDSTVDGSFSNNPKAGQNSSLASGVNLRGLGVSSTLVLLNGHRLAPSALGTMVDISLIPLSAIDRIEILTDGSSAIYGSDAVGGVVNIILKKDYQGAETDARYGSGTDGSRHEVEFSQALGEKWSGGNAIGTLHYQKQGVLPASERDFTSALTTPNDLLPKTSNYAATLNWQQTIAESLQFYGDVLWSKRDYRRSTSFVDGPGDYVSVSTGNSQNFTISPSFRYSFGSWSLELNPLYSRVQSTGVIASAAPGLADSTVQAIDRFVEKSVDIIVDGPLVTTAAGDIRAAVGGSYRQENEHGVSTTTPGAVTHFDPKRHDRAAFAELYFPIVGMGNRMPMLESLDVSAAVRSDRYSDFGSTTNPRIGIHWSPWTDVSVRASYGKSFRAPNAQEEFAESPGSQLIFPCPCFAAPGGGLASALVLEGSSLLKPERARTEDFAIEYKPSNLRGLTVSLGYYDIRYSDRIVRPTFSANALLEPGVYGSLISPVASDAAAEDILAAQEAAGAQFNPYYGTSVAGVRYLIDLKQQNASIVKQTGFDFTSKLSHEFGRYTFTSQLNASFTDKIDTALSPGAAFDNLVNTYGNPPRWRARFDSAWASKLWSIGAAMNAVGRYVNTAVLGTPPIGSWITIDANATVNADALFESPETRGLSLSIVVLNALNRNPPVATAPAPFLVGYDPANANPLGRFASIQLRKVW